MPKMKFSLATLIFIGFGIGIVCGLFFGELCEAVEPVGHGFLLLLQMAVLPYIVCAMIAGIGKLSPAEAVSLAKKVGSFILVLWVVIFVVILCIPYTYPEFESAPFFSKSMIEVLPGPDFMMMYIPANPFQSMANSMVPAVVLFSIVAGVALIGVEKKKHVLDFFDTMAGAMLRIMDMVIKLSPIGIFAITAHAAGTMEAHELGKLQIYFIGYLAFWAILCLWVLPSLVTTLTPFSYRDVIYHYRDVLITAFATGSLFIVLPLMAKRSRELFEKNQLDGDQANTAIDVVVGTSFNFPDLGKLLTLSFIPFAAWFVGAPMSLDKYPSFLMAGLFSFFGDVVMAMFFLLDLLRIPADTFNLFMIVDVPISRFGTMLAAMHTLVLTLLCASATVGILKLQWNRIIRFGVMTLVVIVGLSLGLRSLNYMIFDAEVEMHTLLEMPLRMADDQAAQVMQISSAEARKPVTEGASALERIRQRKVLYAGYQAGNFPFTYYTESHGLIGLDIEMAQVLAGDLEAELVMVPITPANVAEKLNTGKVDVVMSGMVITPERLGEMTFPATHMDITAAFIVEDHLRDEFATQEGIKALSNLKIGVPDLPYYAHKLEHFLPYATIEPLAHASDFFERDDLDALLYSAEHGSAWCILNPSYSVAIPKPGILKLPVGYPVASNDRGMADFMASWIDLKRKDGTIDGLYEHWVLGQGAKSTEPRWSIMRDVLHWVD